MFARTFALLERARIVFIAIVWTPGGRVVKCALPGMGWTRVMLFKGTWSVVGEAWWAFVLEMFPVPGALVFPVRG
jgi:hypothetical protein